MESTITLFKPFFGVIKIFDKAKENILSVAENKLMKHIAYIICCLVVVYGGAGLSNYFENNNKNKQFISFTTTDYSSITERFKEAAQKAYEKDKSSDTTKIMKRIMAAANAKPLDELKKGDIFRHNWQDAENLFDSRKSNEITAKSEISKDDKIMLAMDQYFKFKEYPSTRDIEDMRGFLFRYMDDPSYMRDYQTTDDFVTTQYLKTMASVENDMINKENLAPDLNVEVDDEDLW